MDADVANSVQNVPKFGKEERGRGAIQSFF